MGKLKEHWENIVENSTVWRGQIDYLMEEWKRFVELREELLEWIRKAEAYLEREETVYGYTVSELEEQIDKHKVNFYGGYRQFLFDAWGSIIAHLLA